MKYPKFANIPQCVFPNQRDNERVFVITRRHWVEFLKYIAMFTCLVIIPIVIVVSVFVSSPDTLSVIGVLGRDFLILFLCSFYLLIIAFFVTSWVSYYYDIFIVTDTRIIEITQKGLFNRESYELLFEQIEDVTTREKGFLYTALEAGDVDIQTAGSQRNFEIYRIPKPHIISEIINELNSQSRKGVPPKQRVPTMATVGMIDSIPVLRDGEIPAILNFDKTLSACRVDFHKLGYGKGLRGKFDQWWWSHIKRDQELFADYDNTKGGKEDEGSNL